MNSSAMLFIVPDHRDREAATTDPQSDSRRPREESDIVCGSAITSEDEEMITPSPSRLGFGETPGATGGCSRSQIISAAVATAEGHDDVEFADNAFVDMEFLAIELPPKINSLGINKSKRLYVRAFLLLVLAMAATSVAAFYFLDKKEDDLALATTDEDFGARAWEPENRLKEIVSFLTEKGVVSSAALLTNTPQAQAARWLAYEDRTLTHGVQESNFIQRYALITFALSTSPDLWNVQPAWTQEGKTHECNFVGIHCDEGRQEVTGLLAENFLIPGTVPHEIGLLTKLKVLNLDNNKLGGSLPDALYELTDLEQLYLRSKVGFTSTLSPNFQKLSNLKSVRLGGNLFTGTFPTDAFKRMTKMEVFNIGSISLEGNIVSLLESWPEIEEFTITSTLGVGEVSDEKKQTLPKSLGESRGLRRLIVEGVDADIPTQIGRLTNLVELTLKSYTKSASGNPTMILRSLFPTEIGQLSNLVDFSIIGTSFRGSIPTELGSLTKLEYLRLSSTNMSGTLPSEVGNLSELDMLLIQDNPFLIGTIPEEIGRLAGSLGTYPFIYSYLIRLWRRAKGKTWISDDATPERTL